MTSGLYRGPWISVGPTVGQISWKIRMFQWLGCWFPIKVGSVAYNPPTGRKNTTYIPLIYKYIYIYCTSKDPLDTSKVPRYSTPPPSGPPPTKVEKRWEGFGWNGETVVKLGFFGGSMGFISWHLGLEEWSMEGIPTKSTIKTQSIYGGIYKYTLGVAPGPQDAIVANEGLGWDPLLKTMMPLVVTGILWGGHTQGIHVKSHWDLLLSMKRHG